MFFHVRDFYKLRPEEPGPIVGEPVRFDWVSSDDREDPKAKIVTRMVSPILSKGEIYSFDPQKGWGFILRSGSRVFFHREDFAQPWLPIVGTPVSFWESPGIEKPRAIQVDFLR